MHEVFPAILLLPFCRFSISVFSSFSFIFSIPSWKSRPTLFSARAQASILMVFWPFSRKKSNAKLLEKSERWPNKWSKVKALENKPSMSEWPFFHKMCEKYYRKSCKYIGNNSTKQKGKKISTWQYRSKFRARRYGDKLPKKVGKPWREKSGAQFM